MLINDLWFWLTDADADAYSKTNLGFILYF